MSIKLRWSINPLNKNLTTWYEKISEEQGRPFFKIFMFLRPKKTWKCNTYQWSLNRNKYVLIIHLENWLHEPHKFHQLALSRSDEQILSPDELNKWSKEKELSFPKYRSKLPFWRQFSISSYRKFKNWKLKNYQASSSINWWSIPQIFGEKGFKIISEIFLDRKVCKT